MTAIADAGRITQSEVQDFLFLEADLIDAWQLPEWLQLFTDDASYYVPSTDVGPDALPNDNLFYIADDRYRLGERVKRLMKRTAHSEFPRSKIRHLVSNVRIVARDAEELTASSAFITYRTKDGVSDVYFGTTLHRLVVSGDMLRIRNKRVMLASDGLRQQGRISFLL